jgi:hypothetical protein
MALVSPRILIVLALVGQMAGGLAGRVAAAEAGDCALDAYETARRALAGSEREAPAILGVIGFFGSPRPPQWLVLVEAKEGGRVLRELVVSGGEVRAERRFRAVAGQDLPDIPIDQERLKIDTAAAFAVVERLARKKKIAFESAHFQLRCRDAGDEPVWMLSLVGPAQTAIGAVYLSAESGKVLREVWPEPAVERFSSAER